MTPCQGTVGGVRCGVRAVAVATTGCVREHIVTAPLCDEHLARGESLDRANNLWCNECGPPGHRTRARLRVSHLGEDGGA